MPALVIGVAGGTASGKTTLTREIVKALEGRTCVVYHDNYYKAHDDLPFEERVKLNYDAPDAFDNDLLLEQLQRLVMGEAIECPVYDYTVHNRSAETVRIEPSPVVILEGILIFAEPRILDLIDIKLFVDTDADVRILRRIKRDVLERGRTLESVESQYLKTVKPMHELHVEPSKRNADLIVPNGGNNLVALDMILHRIRRELDEYEDA